MKPLNWNTKLLEAVVQLANVTKGDFPKARLIADEAFKKIGRPNGAKQLNDVILLTTLCPEYPESGHAQASAGIP